MDEPASGEDGEVPEDPWHQTLDGASVWRDDVQLQGAGIWVAPIGPMVKPVNRAKHWKWNQDQEEKRLSNGVIEPGN